MGTAGGQLARQVPFSAMILILIHPFESVITRREHKTFPVETSVRSRESHSGNGEYRWIGTKLKVRFGLSTLPYFGAYFFTQRKSVVVIAALTGRVIVCMGLDFPTTTKSPEVLHPRGFPTSYVRRYDTRLSVPRSTLAAEFDT
ncbi:hypothetical protein BDM02DRAFT_3109474 [Thelephora ganbajun]|uniref:Uncharacterized protein n=1 Tax=Thelephora ganbajun TaxID=370292 RepID=A0ACB6ZSJ9_THEGA|nr:hypothetical protein BDM02DRAFT_3109474 [Thelephora ganbajun]